MTQGIEQPPSPRVLEQGYEPPDVSNLGLIVFFIILVLLITVVQVGVWALIKHYVQLPRAADTVTSIAPAPARFPAPNLQPVEKHNALPREDLQMFLKEKNGILQRLGWNIDPQTGLPEIPDQIVNELAKERGGNSTSAAQGGGR
jgi:Na+-transporting methylmalonyl-CoA/oxaloacetate decarboxylase gamma subunit